MLYFPFVTSTTQILWSTVRRCAKSKRSRPSVFIVKVPFRPPEAYVCAIAQQQYTSRHTPSKLSSHSKQALAHSLSPPNSHRSTSSDHLNKYPSRHSTSHQSVSSSQALSHSSKHLHSQRGSSNSRGPALSQPHSRMHQDDHGLHGVEVETDPLDYHSCSDPSCQANLDAYFLHRIETYTPMLQMMRSRRKKKGSSISDHDSAPVVVVTNWQHAEQYPPEWVTKFKQVCPLRARLLLSQRSTPPTSPLPHTHTHTRHHLPKVSENLHIFRKFCPK